MGYFEGLGPGRFRGGERDDALAFRHYDPARRVLGKRLDEQLRFAVCYWHTLGWDGRDVFGAGTFQRPWHRIADPLQAARARMDEAFAFMDRLGAPFWTFHDYDIAPEGASLRESCANLERMVDYAAGRMEETGVRLLWGTANLFGNPRYAAGAATNPDPAVFACAASQVQAALAATHRLGGANYVMWGGREGYETLLNTDLRREYEQMGRFLAMVVEYKHRLGFQGPILLEPKPQEPTKHQYDYDVATVYGFLERFDLKDDVRVNIEVNHATLAGHSFQHEVAMAWALDIFGSVDANRGDYQNGWDTDQFPNSVEELTPACYEILRGGGFDTGGFNFDTKLRRQSMDLDDLLHSHIGGMDTVALAWCRPAELLERETLSAFVRERYAGWDEPLGRAILAGDYDLESLAAQAVEQGLDPRPVSGRQELLENRVNAVIHG